MRWLPIAPDVRESECGKFRITRHSKGYSSWLRHEGKRKTEWIRLAEPFKTHAEAIKECEANNPKGDDHAPRPYFQERPIAEGIDILEGQEEAQHIGDNQEG